MSSPVVVLVGNDKGGDLAAFRLIDDELRPLARTSVGVGCSTFAVDTDGALVYTAVKEPEPAIVTLRLDRASGGLSEVARRKVDDPLAYVALSGDVLLGASYHGGWGASWPVTDDVPGPETARLSHRNLHAAVADPQGRNAYFASLGEDLIAQFAIGADAQLSALAEATVSCPEGSGPRHLVVSADGHSAYLLTEFTGEAIRFDRAHDGSLTQAETALAYDTTAGLGRNALGLDPRADHLIWGADLAFMHDGRWLVCSERTESTITAIELDNDGRLTDHTVVSSTEEQPRGLTVTPDGTRLIVVGERSGHASLYGLDDGHIVPLDRVETGTGPNWVRCL